MTRRYYWLKLKEDFFDDDTISYIEEQENGVYYVNFYLKLCLKSLKADGRLIRLVGDTFIPYDAKSLAKLTNTPIDTVRAAMSLFQQIGLVKLLDTGELYLAQMDELIGSETDKAHLMRRKRAESKALSRMDTPEVLDDGNIVTQALPKRYTEIEIEKEKELELDEDILSSSNELNESEPHEAKNAAIIEEIVDYFNFKTHSHNSPQSKGTIKLINARLKEGHAVDEFKKIVDVKTEQWMYPKRGEKDMTKYLRIKTLFNEVNFDEYLNEALKREDADAELDDIPF